jgi:hypothetical protein
MPKSKTYICPHPENFIKILAFHQKLFNFLVQTDTQTDAQTDTQTDVCPPIHIQTGEKC